MGDELRFLDEMERFLANYRNGVADHLKAEDADMEAYKDHMYKPGMYWLFGPFDLAVLSLIDDYEIACQTFHPLHPDYPAPKNERGQEDKSRPQRHFAHRVIVGPCPRWSEGEIAEGAQGYKSDPYKRKLVELAGKTFLREANKDGKTEPQPMPLIAICRLEVNNSLLIGGGGNLLRCLVKAVEAAFDEFRKKDGREAHIIILEGYSWHELTLLVFGRSFRALDHFVDRIRRTTLLDVGELLYSTARKDWSYREEWGELLKLSNLYLVPGSERPLTLMEWKDKRIESEISRAGPDLTPDQVQDQAKAMKDYIENPDPAHAGAATGLRDQCLDIRPFGTHVFFNTTTALGFTANLLKTALEKLNSHADELKTATQEVARTIVEQVITDVLDPPEPAGPNKTQPWPDIDDTEEDRTMTLIRRWSMKAGHDVTGVQAVNGVPTEEFLLSSGRMDVVYPCELPGRATVFGNTSSRGAVAEVLKQTLNTRVAQLKLRQEELDDNGEPKEPAAGLLTAQSTLGWQPDEEQKKHVATRTPLGHSSANKVRRDFCWSKKQLDEVFKNLKALRVPKVVVGRVLNALAQFNEGIQDNFLFSSFLELRPYTERIVNLIEDQADAKKTDAAGVSIELNRLIDNFETGWRNRFHGGWRLGEISDFNLEFKGGIQQLVTAFHVAYRMLSWYYARDLSTLAVVTGRPSVTVRAGAARLNLYDVFHPQFFCARASHEAGEQLLGRSKADWAEFMKNFPTLNEIEQRLDRSQEFTEAEKKDLLAAARSLTRKEMERHFEAVRRLSWAHLRVKEREERKDPPGKFFSQWWQGRGKTKTEEAWTGVRRSLGEASGGAISVDALYEIGCTLSVELKLFDQLYADMCNFHSVFLGDCDLYSYWWLASFVVDPLNWRSPGQLEPDRLREALLRIAFVFAARVETSRGQLGGKKSLHAKALDAVKKYWRELADEKEIQRWHDIAEKVVRKALEHSTATDRADKTKRYEHEELAILGDWLRSAAYLAKSGLETGKLIRELGKVGELQLPSPEKNRLLLGKPMVDYYVRDVLPGARTRRDEAHECLSRGRAYVGGQSRCFCRQLDQTGGSYPFEADRWFDFCDVAALMHAYLKLLKDGSGIDDLCASGRMVLQRDAKTGDVCREPKEGTYAELVFDPRGGVFTFSPEFRRKDFMWRSAFVMSLYDIAEKAKLVYCDQFLRRREAPPKPAEPCV